MLLSDIREKVRHYRSRELEASPGIRASVMVPLLQKDDGVHILLTKRTDEVKAHPGEISFPGGMYEEQDGDTMRTALRESCEEIGVSMRDVEIIGRLDDERTLTGFVITPYVGVIPYPYNFTISRREVAYLVHLPYAHLVRGDTTREATDYRGRMELIDAIYYNGERIWGATCRILLKLKRIVDHEHG